MNVRDKQWRKPSMKQMTCTKWKFRFWKNIIKKTCRFLQWLAYHLFFIYLDVVKLVKQKTKNSGKGMGEKKKTHHMCNLGVSWRLVGRSRVFIEEMPGSMVAVTPRCRGIPLTQWRQPSWGSQAWRSHSCLPHPTSLVLALLLSLPFFWVLKRKGPKSPNFWVPLFPTSKALPECFSCTSSNITSQGKPYPWVSSARPPIHLVLSPLSQKSPPSTGVRK